VVATNRRGVRDASIELARFGRHVMIITFGSSDGGLLLLAIIIGSCLTNSAST
jgi:hypothetical protein